MWRCHGQLTHFEMWTLRLIVNTLHATVGLLRSTPKEKPSPDFKQRIREQVNRERGN